jgi:EmrB/QacA subfamily drug resistance transporter
VDGRKPGTAGGGTSTSRHYLRWFALAVLATAFFMGVLDSTSGYAALPTIAADLDFSPVAIQWVMTGYGVTVGGLLLLGGRLADLLGRRRVFMTAVALFAAASLCCGLAWSSEVLVAARVAQGVGAATMTPAGLSILMTIFPEGADRNRALAVWGGLGGIGATAGLLIGGTLTDTLGWAWIFFVNVPVCLAVLAASPALLPESRDRRRTRTFDLAGAVTITAALVLLLYSLFTVAEAGRPTALTGALLAATAVLTGLFVVIESRSAAPLVPLRIFRSRTLVGGNLVMLAAGIAVDGLLIVLTLYMQQVLRFSALEFGLALAVMTATSVGCLLLAQRAVTRIGFRAVAATGMALLGLACLLLARLPMDGSFAVDLLPGLLVFGAGLGAAFVAAQIAALTGVSDDEAGLASGIEETSFAVGTTLGVAIATGVAVTHAAQVRAAGAAAEVAQIAGFQAAFHVAAGSAALGLIAALTLLAPPATRRPQHGQRTSHR